MDITVQKIDVENILMDVDGTMTTEKRDNVFVMSPLEHLLKLLSEIHGISGEEAIQMIEEIGNPETNCLFNFLDTLKIPKEVYWNSLVNDVSKSIEIPDDTASFIKSVRGKGIKLFSATTNSKMMTLLKLSIAGLASIDGSPYFDGFFGGDAFNDPKGKFSDNFFPSIMKSGKFDPERTMMIGDNEQWDMTPALHVGIKNVVIINREQPESLIFKNGVMFVNRLTAIMEML